MGAGEFGDESVTVVLVPSGIEGDRLLELARIWTGSWLLSPGIWVRADDVPVGGELPPEIPAVVIGRAREGGPGEARVELFWKLGERFRPRVRLVAVRMKQDSQGLQNTAVAIHEIDRYLTRALPLNSTWDSSHRDGEIGTDFRRINLIVDAAEVSGLHSGMVFEYGWDINLVASPEDRAEPFGPDSPPIAPERGLHWDLSQYDPVLNRAARYYGWVLGHVATAGGLWAGLDDSIYDERLGGGTSHELCIVQRVVVRGVLTDGLAIDLAISAMEAPLRSGEQEARALQDALQAHGIEALPDALVPERVEELVNASLAGFRSEGFGYLPPPEVAQWTPVKESIGKAILRVIRVGWRASLRIPAILYSLVLQRASDKLNVAEGETQVDSALTWDAGLPKIGQEVFRIPEVSKPSVTGLRASPELWRDMKAILLSAVDGSETSADASALLKSSKTGKSVVFPSRTDLLPDPDASWTPDPRASIRLPDGPVIGWLDYQRAENAFAQVDRDYAQRQRELDAARAKAAASEREVDRVSLSLADLDYEIGERELELEEVTTWLNEVRYALNEEDGERRE